MRDLYNLVVANQGLEVAHNSEPPQQLGSTATLPPGSYFSVPVGVGPVSVIVPSGLTFGTDEVGPVERTLDQEGHYLYLPEGATIVASGTGSFGVNGNAHGNVS